MRETHSRLLLAAGLLLALPSAAFVMILAVPATLMLIPMALFGLGATLLAGGPRWAEDLWTGSGVLVMGLIGLCTVASVACLGLLAVVFLVGGRSALRQRPRLLRIGLLWALPPLLLSTLPRFAEALAAGPIDADRVLAALVLNGVPLVLPVAHLVLEARGRGRR